MSVEIAADEGRVLEAWDDYVARSSQGTLFHTRAFLEALARHSETTLHVLAGYKGQEPVGIFPVFDGSVGPFDTVFSPPPNVGMFELGPALLNVDGLKQRKREKRTRRFVEGCLDWIRAELDPSYLHLRTHHEFDALRPFQWSGFRLSPQFDYVVDIDGDEDDLLMRFSGDARSNIRGMEDRDCTVEERGTDGVRRVIAHVNRRFEEQDEPFPIDEEYVLDLSESLPDGRLRSYVCTVEGTFATGMITLEGDDTVYRWQGGGRPAVDLPANDYLDWRIMQEARARGKSAYDLVGANTPRLTEYKAKFDPDVVEYHSIVGGTRWGRIAAEAYQRIPHVRSIVGKTS